MASTALVLDRRRERAFYISMAVLAAVLVFVGFARTYFLKEVFGGPALRPLVHLHGFLFTSWIVLFVVQTCLVAAKRTDIHRKLGVAGGVLASLMIIVGPLTAIAAARRGGGSAAPPDIPPLVFLVIPLGDIVIFSALIGAALWLRRKADLHKRLMLLTTIVLLPPAVARIPLSFGMPTGPLIFFGIPDLILLACIAYDWSMRRKLNPAFLWGGLAIIAWQPLRMMMGGTHAWMSFAQWLVR
jgi:hypothetical protein